MGVAGALGASILLALVRSSRQSGRRKAVRTVSSRKMEGKIGWCIVSTALLEARFRLRPHSWFGFVGVFGLALQDRYGSLPGAYGRGTNEGHTHIWGRLAGELATMARYMPLVWFC